MTADPSPHLDRERCIRAVAAKDTRFDGWFFTAVTSTGIYCRPSCPARAPRPAHMVFYPTAAAAQQAGFRACKRCRPDASPGSPEWSRRADAVARAMRLVADGVVDREGVRGLASRLGYSPRQLERLLAAELGAGPLALARAQRAQTARLLVESTALSLSDVAFAAGFASVRQFNDTVRAVFASTPTELRRRAAGAAPAPGAGTLALRLPVRRPFAPGPLFAHLAATAVPGLEEWDGCSYRRSLRLPIGAAVVSLAPAGDHVACQLRLDDLRDLAAAVARCRRLLDLDADPQAVDALCGADPALAAAVAASPGQRMVRTVDEEEWALRCLLGQQVSTAAAARLAAQLLRAVGRPLQHPDGGVTHLWPTPAEVADRAPTLGAPVRRRVAFLGLARALADGHIALGAGSDWDRARAGLAAVPGVGAWTVEMIVMRGLGDPDAFPASDLGLRRAAGTVGLPTTPAALTAAAARWRPWRSYATQYLWSTLDHPVNRLPVRPEAGPLRRRPAVGRAGPTPPPPPQRRHRARPSQRH